MPQIEIDEWLRASRPNFQRGVFLHNTFARDDERVSKALLKADTSISRKKLRASLMRIAERHAKLPTPKKVATRERGGHKWGQTQGYPPHLVELDLQLPLITSEINSLANSTIKYDEGDKLKALVLEICEKFKQRAEKWKELDYYADHGVVMPGTGHQAEPDLIEKLVDWLDRQPALIDYTRRYRSDTNPKKVAEVAKRTKELEKIQAFIKAHKR